MSSDDSIKWNRIYNERHGELPAPVRVLEQHSYLLPGSGTALDLACGRGRNALLLAKLGLETHAWDISSAALEQLEELARLAGVRIRTRECDLTRVYPEENGFDVIVVSHYLDRKLPQYLIKSLRRDGLLFYQTFIREKPAGTGPGNPDFLLKENELLHMFRELHTLFYQEEGLVGRLDHGVRNEALLIAQKR